MAIRELGQVFDKMHKLAGFLGLAELWDSLAPAVKAEYAGLCRRSPSETLFELEKWQANIVIQAKVAEWKAEKELEALASPNLNLDF